MRQPQPLTQLTNHTQVAAMLAFVHLNKTAGSTVRYVLRSSFGLRHCEVEPWHDSWKPPPFSTDDLRRLRKVYPSLRSIGGHRVHPYVDLDGDGTPVRFFTFMRDPVKTCASRFQYNVQYRGKSDLVFEEWIQNDWTRNSQTQRIAGTPDAEEAIRIIQAKSVFVGLTERFDESMLLLKTLVADDLNIAYRRVNTAKKNSIAEHLLATERTRQMLIEANQEDMKLYSWVRDELFPTLQREYGSSLDADLAHYKRSRSDGFNRRNLTLSRLKQYGVYKPLLYLYRRTRAA